MNSERQVQIELSTDKLVPAMRDIIRQMGTGILRRGEEVESIGPYDTITFTLTLRKEEVSATVRT